jgi:hypothetical protein
MTNLSSAAQAVLDAALDADFCIEFTDLEATMTASVQRVVAAALRTAANQIKLHASRTPWLINENGYFNETFENLEALIVIGELNSYSKLLAIADELEGAK